MSNSVEQSSGVNLVSDWWRHNTRKQLRRADINNLNLTPGVPRGLTLRTIMNTTERMS